MLSAALRRASASRSRWVRGFASKPSSGALGKPWAIELIKDAAGVTTKQAEASYKALLEGVASSVAKGERVTFQGFGTFEKTSRAARAGVNPQTGAAIQIPATQAPKFKAADAFKQLVKGREGGGGGRVAREATRGAKLPPGSFQFF